MIGLRRSPDAHGEITPLASLMTRMLALALALIAANLGIYVISGHPIGAAVAILGSIAALLLFAARQVALKGRRQAALTLFTLTLSLAALAMVWIEPDSLPIMVLFPPLVLITALQYMTRSELGLMVITASLVSLALVISGELARPLFPEAQPLTPAMHVFAMVGVTGVLAAMLWSYSSRLLAALARLEKANRALSESEARYRAIVEDQTELICRSQPDGVILLVNEASCRYWGLPRAELVGGDLRRYIHPEDVPLLEQHLASLTPDQPVGVIEHRVVLRDGGMRWQQWTNRALFDGEQLLGYQSVGRDVTVRRQVEERLFRSERQFKAIAENAPDIIARYDRDFRFLYVNPAFHPVTGMTSEQALGKTHYELGVPHEIAALWEDRLSAAMATKHVQTAEFDLLTPQGVRNYESRIVPELGPNGEVESLLAISRDVTERRMQEITLQHQQKRESLGVMAGGISHEFNNLLGIMLGNAELLQMNLAQDAANRPLIEAIASAGRRAAALMRQMLAYVGQNRLNITVFDINSLIEEMESLLQASIPRSAALAYRLTPDLPRIEGDVSQLRQILLNLTINSAEAIGELPGTIEIVTSARTLDRPFLAGLFLAPDLPAGEYVILEIRDTGCGMDSETLRRVFDPFFTTKFVGRGLGLPATLGIVRSHHGGIRIDSAAGQGTTVTIVLPGIQKPNQPSHLPHYRGAAPDSAPGGIVLVLDDEEGVRDVATRMLESMGYSVLASGDVRTALRLARQHTTSIACILLDMTMPQQNTKRTIDDLRRISGAIPIVLMSGYTEDIASRRFSDLGLNGFLQKPFTSVELRDTIGRAQISAGDMIANLSTSGEQN